MIVKTFNGCNWRWFMFVTVTRPFSMVCGFEKGWKGTACKEIRKEENNEINQLMMYG